MKPYNKVVFEGKVCCSVNKGRPHCTCIPSSFSSQCKQRTRATWYLTFHIMSRRQILDFPIEEEGVLSSLWAHGKLSPTRQREEGRGAMESSSGMALALSFVLILDIGVRMWLHVAHSVLFFRAMQIGAYIVLSGLPASRSCVEANYSFELLLWSIDRGIWWRLGSTQFCQAT